MNQAVILTNGHLTGFEAKTAHGLIRISDRYRIAGVIDGPQTAGQDAGTLLDGRNRQIPVFGNLTEARNKVGKLDFLIIGVATVGGYLPADMLDIIREAIQHNLSIVNGLHEFLSEKPEIQELADRHGVQLIDIRKPRPRKDLHFWTGEILRIPASIVAVLGMDCATGKRTTARMIQQACQAGGLNAQMIYTGQTGWLQGGKYGFILDSTINDFVSGELEHAILTCWKETQAAVILLEGQSSLRNPSGPCGSELLISGRAKHTVLVYAPKRRFFDEDPAWGEIPSVGSEIDLIEKLGSRVIALALNTHMCSPEECKAYQIDLEQQFGIPVILPIQEGVDQIIPILEKLRS